MLHHVCIQTNRYAQSLAFYRTLLDAELITETAGFHGRAFNTWLRVDGLIIELQTPKDGDSFAPMDTQHEGVSHLCFFTEDIPAKYRQLREKGICDFLLHGGQAVYEVNGGKLFKVRAPEGTVIEFRDKVGC